MTTKAPPRRASAKARNERAARARRQQRRRLLVRMAALAAGGVVVLFLLFETGRDGGGGPSGPRFDVGAPGPGAEAPTFALPSTGGGSYDLAAARGKSVLLYFQEGLMCQPCWDQITAIEKDMAKLRALGVDEFVSITTDPLPLLRQKAADEGIRSPVLADVDLSLADDYNANRYGMMGTSRYGHSFVLVGPDGRIRWRADYGGAPDYTMFLAVSDLLEDMSDAQARIS